jgi:virginiamycin A acetyltransferase
MKRINNILKGLKKMFLVLQEKAFLFSRGDLRNTISISTGFHNRYFINNFRVKGSVKIGNYCTFGEHIRVISSDHNYHYPALQNELYRNVLDIDPPKGASRQVIIGSDVWIGDNVILLKGASLGNGVIIGAGSVVTKAIPDYAIAAGVPARVISYRFRPERISELLEIAWWNWDSEKMIRNKKFFSTDIQTIPTHITLNSLIVE